MIISTYDEIEKGNRPNFAKKSTQEPLPAFYLDPAPQVTHIQEATSPPPPNAEHRNKEETPSFEDRDDVQDNSKLKQGDTMLATCPEAWLPYM